MNIIGHKDIVSFFENATAVDKLHHAYLFVGRAALGKRTLAAALAAQWFGDSQAHTLAQNPDFFVLERGINEKTGKTRKHIGVEQVHELRHFLQGKPFVSKKKIAIINDAELLSVGAMNALLKTLEEPRGESIVFLICTDESALLETIRSRCQCIYFHPVAERDIVDALVATHIDTDRAEAMAADAAGLPGRALLWAADEEQYASFAREKERCTQLFGASFAQKLSLVDDLFAKKDDHIEGRAALCDVLDIWQTVLRSQYLGQRSNGPGSDFGDQYDIVEAYSAIISAKKGLSQNIHPRMLIEQVLLALP